MRIIAGRFRRRLLHAPPGKLTRPSTDRTREALFGMVESRMSLSDADVLDLFAGSGALGLEALSRGGRSALFVESDSRVLRYARQNAEELEIDAACQFIRADAVGYLRRYKGKAFDLILADPPYELASLRQLPDLALPHVAGSGLFVLEHDSRLSFGDDPRLDVSRAYGQTIVSIFRSSMESSGDGDPHV